MKLFNKKYSSNTENVSYWISISDLMASTLIIFILLFVFQIYNISNSLREKEEIIENITSIKDTIIERLEKEFSKKNIDILVDPLSGSVLLKENILFNLDEFEIKESGKEYLRAFIPTYIKILLSDSYIKDEIAQIIIEGHTDDSGSYMYNLQLSQKRAFEVVKFIYEEMENFDEKELLKEYITANGKGEIFPIKSSDGGIDRNRSRRVEFKFQLKEGQALKKLSEQIQKGE